jgi:hypothetical protein
MKFETGGAGEFLRIRDDKMMVAPIYLDSACFGTEFMDTDELSNDFRRELHTTLSDATGIDEHDHDALEALLESDEGFVPFISLPYTADRLTALQKAYAVGLQRELEIILTEYPVE